MSTNRRFRLATPDDRDRLYEIWHGAVKTTHHFLSDAQFDEIAHAVKTEFLPNVAPEVLTGADDVPLAFMSMTDHNIDALFVAADERGSGIGSAFLERTMAQFDTLTLEVNEQNPTAHAFYRHHGFEDVRRTPIDQEGRPFPLIYMRWQRGAPSS